METITLPESLICIEESAFAECEKLSSITIPASVKSIGKLAFHNCRSLKKLTILGKVSADDLAFAGCDKLNPKEYKMQVVEKGRDVWD